MTVVVVGGGVIGLAVAWRAAGRGLDVTVVDPAPTRGASWVAGGMLAPVAEAARGEEALTALGLASASRWSAFAADLRAGGHEPGYGRHGTLIVARDQDDVGDLADQLLLQQGAGLTAERVTSRQARRLEPALAPTVRGALWLPDDHQVDNRRLLSALLAACRAAGVGFVAEPAVAIDAHAVTVASGVRLPADAVVLATGAQAPPLVLDGEPVALPLRPVKGQIVRLRATPAAVCPTRTVRGLDVYVIPRDDGEIAIGATAEEKGDTTVTAGGVLDLLRDAWELVPGLAEARFVEAAAGLRPGTPDNAPLLGRWPTPGGDGPILATGHYRHGVLLAPVTAEVVADLLTGVTPSVTLEAFRPDRFTTGGREAAAPTAPGPRVARVTPVARVAQVAGVADVTPVGRASQVVEATQGCGPARVVDAAQTAVVDAAQTAVVGGPGERA